MRPGMRMLAMDKVRQPDRHSEYGADPHRRRIGYEQGGLPPEYRRHYPPMDYDEEPEARRRRDRKGRYMMDGMDDDDDDRYHVRDHSDHQMSGGAKWEKDDDWCDKLKRTSFKAVDEHQAMEWVSEMEAENGRQMPVFRIEDTESQRKVMCPDCEKWEFFVAMNAMYADYQPVGMKYGAGDKPEFYAMMAKLFLCDKDAGRHKLQKYMMSIPR